MKRATLVLAIAALTASLLPAAEKTPPAPIEYGPARLVCTLANQEIDESSGVACSRRNEGVFWTHNDSGDPPRIFAFNAKGEDLAVFELKGAIHHDWEDMASFTHRAKSGLLIADVGDNDEMRDQYTLYIVREPRVDPTKRGVRDKLKVEAAVDFTYEDGSHNCEAVGVDTASKLVLLITKVQFGKCKAYAIDLPEEKPKAPLLAKAIATLSIPLVTAMDVSPDGLRAIVLTYGNAFEFTRAPDEKWSAAFARAPRTLVMPPRRQGEGICYGPDGKTLYLTSEKAPCPFFEVPVAGTR